MEQELQNILTKRFQTTMIGALFEFEKAFGYLWGQHKPEDEDLTDSEIKFFDLWDSVRNQILNNGNNQLRKAIADLNKFSSNTNVKYHYRFYNKRKDNL